MNKSLFALLIAATFASTFAAEPEPSQPDIAFFTQLRMNYSQRKGFKPNWNMDDERKAVFDAYHAKDYKKAFELSERWLAKCPVDSTAHLLRSSAAREIGDLKSHIYHQYFAYALMQSILQSGDGLSPKTAFKVISISEEYAVLRAFGANVTRQALLAGAVDELSCEFPGIGKTTRYFDASIPFNAEAALLEQPKPQP